MLLKKLGAKLRSITDKVLDTFVPNIAQNYRSTRKFISNSQEQQ